MNTTAVPLSQLPDYDIIDKAQDVRGWPVTDAQDHTVGHVKDMLVDTDQHRVSALLLDDGRQLPVSDIALADKFVRFVDRGATAASAEASAEQVLPVIEEQFRVGKRGVDRGGVRVQAHVTSTPVEENVRLREEHVSVERRPVDREVSAADARGLQDRTVEMTARGEEAVVSKTARVVEEVVVRKDVRERTETVRDTVKRTDVSVDDTTGSKGRDYADKTASDSDDDRYAPAYQFGKNMTQDKRYAGRPWEEVEPHARSAWEGQKPGTWESFKAAVQHAWEKVSS